MIRFVQHRHFTMASIAVVLANTAFPSSLLADCNELLRLGYMNLASTVATSDLAESERRNFCIAEYDFASDTEKKEIEGSASLFGIFSAGGGYSNFQQSIRQRQSTECSFVDHHYVQRQYIDARSATISQGALSAWTTCLTLEQHGLHVDVRVNPLLTNVEVQLTYTGSTHSRFTGIDLDHPNDLKCTATHPGTLHPSVTENVDPSTTFDLGTTNVTISCNRALTHDPSGVDFVDADRVTLKTADGDVLVDFPALKLTRVSIADLTDLQKRVSNLEQLVQKAEAHITGLEAAANTILSPAPCPQGWTDHGTVGVVIRTSDAPQSPWAGGGGGPNAGWVWTHPQVCKKQ